MAAPQKSADGSVTVETRWMEGKGQFVNEFVLDISLLMEGNLPILAFSLNGDELFFDPARAALPSGPGGCPDGACGIV